MATAQGAADAVADRAATLGSWADGRAETVSSTSELESFPDGRTDVEAAVVLMADRLYASINVIRRALEPMGDLDPITEDLLLGICGQLEKHLWMVQVQDEDQ